MFQQVRYYKIWPDLLVFSIKYFSRAWLSRMRFFSVEPVQPQASSDEADPSKLSLAERVKLFNQKITHERLPIAGGVPPASGGILRKPRHARFKTQPVTNEEMESVQKISPLAASLVKPPNADTLGSNMILFFTNVLTLFLV